jgi:hypothetical protein
MGDLRIVFYSMVEIVWLFGWLIFFLTLKPSLAAAFEPGAPAFLPFSDCLNQLLALIRCQLAREFRHHIVHCRLAGLHIGLQGTKGASQLSLIKRLLGERGGDIIKKLGPGSAITTKALSAFTKQLPHHRANFIAQHPARPRHRINSAAKAGTAMTFKVFIGNN